MKHTTNGEVTDLNSWEVKNISVRLEFTSLKKITVVFLILSHPAAESLKLIVLTVPEQVTVKNDLSTEKRNLNSRTLLTKVDSFPIPFFTFFFGRTPSSLNVEDTAGHC